VWTIEGHGDASGFLSPDGRWLVTDFASDNQPRLWRFPLHKSPTWLWLGWGLVTLLFLIANVFHARRHGRQARKETIASRPELAMDTALTGGR
jgi:hypothetical protein